jgi:asparagine synthase (glutamine-hydrolysing)
VPPAHVVTLGAAGSASRRYWDYQTPKPVQVSFADAVQQYREKFLDAVRRRVTTGSPVVITVSGGLDSSSIFCAAMHLREQGETLPPIHGVAFVSDHAPADERHYISDIEAKYGVKIEQFPLKYDGLLTESEDQVYIMEAPLLQWNAFHRIHQFARERGARTLLSGFFGDQILQSPLYVVDEFLALRWLSAWKGFHEYRKWWGEAYPLRDSVVDFLQEAKGFLIPEALRPVYQRLKKVFTGASASLPFYSADFHERVRALEGDALPTRMRPASAYAKGILHQVYSRKHATLLEMDIKLSASYGIHLSHPFRDRDLIQFMLSIPGHVAYEGGASRAIHREAMKGILPESIRMRLSKGDYTRPVNWAMKADAERFRGCLEGSKSIKAGYLALAPELSKALEKAQSELELDSSIAVWALADVLALEEWLKTFFDAKMDAANPLEA